MLFRVDPCSKWSCKCMLVVRFAHANCVLWLLLQELFSSFTPPALWLTKIGSIPASCLRRWLLKLQSCFQDDYSGTWCNCVCINTPSSLKTFPLARTHSHGKGERMQNLTMPTSVSKEILLASAWMSYFTLTSPLQCQ